MSRVVGGFQSPLLAAPPNDWAPDQEEFPYRAYTIRTSYPRASGCLLLPVAGPAGTPAHLVDVVAPYGRKVVTWAVIRQGAKPVLPAPESQQCLAEATPVFEDSKVLPGGQVRLFYASGTYVYNLALPFTEADSLPTGAPPVQVRPLSAEENQVLPAQWQAGIT